MLVLLPWEFLQGFLPHCGPYSSSSCIIQKMLHLPRCVSGLTQSGWMGANPSGDKAEVLHEFRKSPSDSFRTSQSLMVSLSSVQANKHESVGAVSISPQNWNLTHFQGLSHQEPRATSFGQDVYQHQRCYLVPHSELDPAWTQIQHHSAIALLPGQVPISPAWLRL